MGSGVYVIVNKVSGKQYVGSAVDFDKRKLTHFSKLRGGNHSSNHLQASFKKYGESAFSFSTLEELVGPTRDQLLSCEQKWIDILRPAYNKRLVADNNLGVHVSVEARAAQSAFMKEHVASTEGREHIERLAAHNKALWSDPEHRAKRIAKVKAHWTPEKRAEQSEFNKAKQRHILIDGTHFGSRRVWDEDEKSRVSETQRKRWEVRQPREEAEIVALVTSTNPMWEVREMTGVRNKHKVLVFCKEHNHEQWQTIAKVRYEHRGCKLCGYKRSSEVQSGRFKSIISE